MTAQNKPLKQNKGVPFMVQRLTNPTRSMRIRVWFLASLSRLRIRHRWELWCRSQTQLDPKSLWLWRRPAAAAPIGPLAWVPYVAGAALKKKDKLGRCLSATTQAWEKHHCGINCDVFFTFVSKGLGYKIFLLKSKHSSWGWFQPQSTNTFSLFGYAHSMWKFLGHGFNLHHNSDNAGSLTHWTTRKRLISTLTGNTSRPQFSLLEVLHRTIWYETTA